MQIPKKTRAAILSNLKQELVVDEIELPDHLSFGQILVEFDYSGICGSQLGEINGIKGPDKWLPHLLGHEGLGKVISIGPGVSRVHIGDSVVAHWRKSSGIESTPPKYKWKGKDLNAGFVTTFNRHAVISENRLTKVQSDVNPLTAPLFGCAVTTGFGAVENVADVKIGENVIIFGSGGIGLNLIQAAKIRGANEIIAIDLYSNRLELAKEVGATNIINAAECDPWEKLYKFNEAKKLDVFFDNTGDTNIIAKGYEVIKNNGRLILLGVPNYEKKTSINTLDLHFGKKIKGTTGGESKPDDDIPRYMEFFKKNNICLKKLISDVSPLSKINVLIKKMRDGSASGRCIVDLRNE